MTDPLYFLNSEDKSHLQLMLTWFKQRRVNTPLRSPQDLHGRSSDTYIAVPTAETGIPALTRDGNFNPETNTDTPGYAECDIYQIIDEGDGLPVIKPAFFKVIVYNLSLSAIEQDWIPVTRDKFGSWIVKPGASATCNDVYFEIVDDGSGTAEVVMTGTSFSGSYPIARILGRPCGCPSVPGEVEGMIEVHPMRCLTIAVGMEGWAKYIQLEDTTGTAGTGTAGGLCKWYIYSLCCEDS